MLKKLIGWLFFIVSVVLATFAYYLKFPDFRAWVDDKAPIVKQVAGPVIVQWDERFPRVVVAPAETPDNIITPAATPVPEAVAKPSATPLTAVAAEPAASPRDEAVDVSQLSRARNEWPKLVSLKKIVEFPAVLDGKVIGSLKAPAGTQVQLVLIQGDKAGLEYQGGGAMVAIADTDLIERVQSSRHASVH